MSIQSDGSIETQVVGAIRLALEGAANDKAALTMVQWIVRQAPDADPADTSSVKLFIEGIRALGFAVTTDSPSGTYAP